jgi:hypothetical protein
MSDTFTTTIEKSARVQVRVTIGLWKGRYRVSIREYTAAPVEGEWWPSARGVSLDLAKIGELVNAIRMAEAETVKRGLLAKERPA